MLRSVYAFQALVEYGGITGSLGGVAGAALGRLEAFYGFLTEHAVLTVGVIVALVLLWRFSSGVRVR